MSRPDIQRANRRLVELARRFFANERRIGPAQLLADQYLWASPQYAAIKAGRAGRDGSVDNRHAELEAAVQSIIDESDRLLREICDTPAMNYADLVLKLRFAAEAHGELVTSLDDDGESDDVAIIASVIRDAERLAVGAS